MYYDFVSSLRSLPFARQPTCPRLPLLRRVYLTQLRLSTDGGAHNLLYGFVAVKKIIVVRSHTSTAHDGARAWAGFLCRCGNVK